MNAAEIADAVDELFSAPLDPAEFPYAFLQAFGNKETTLRKLRTGDTNKSDVGGVLQRNNIHLIVAPPGQVSEALDALRGSPATARHKVKFILATDGERIEAEELGGGTPLECAWSEFPDHFGLFLPLAGISTVKEIRENAFDIRATAKLNRLYVELLKENPEWGTDEHRPDMNHFMARLIFSFFAEDTGIFAEEGLFTKTISQLSERDSSNTHEVIGTLFSAMNTKHGDREGAGLPRWATKFPYVNGGLFSGELAVPRFTRTARSYLLQVGSLDWKQINPDIFGSMIQAVADDEERGALGMHYTSVPNILKVLNPLFLDDLRAKLEEADDNPRKLLNLRNRIKRIRVFDPACGSGNFLVIAYKEMRAIEAEINRRRKEVGRFSEIPLTNFRGIELRDFAAEIARLALIIAEFQCDVLYRGQQEALNDFLPLDAENWITCGNALRLDWLAICPPTGTSVKLLGDDLFSTPLDQSEIDFENAGGETFICGNPPYLGSRAQTQRQKDDLAHVVSPHTDKSGLLDYVAGWFIKATEFGQATASTAAFVATNSICQGQQVPVLWPVVFSTGQEIAFAHTSFKWTNLASHNAGVTVVIIAIARKSNRSKILYSALDNGESIASEVANISPYLVASANVFVGARKSHISAVAELDRGSAPTDDGAFFLGHSEYRAVIAHNPAVAVVLHRAIGGADFIRGNVRWILKVSDDHLTHSAIAAFATPRLRRVSVFRANSKKRATQIFAGRPLQFTEDRHFAGRKLFVPQLMSEGRDYVTCGLLAEGYLVLAPHFQAPATELHVFALVSSRLHMVWIDAVCGKLKTDVRYSNTLGWNTFPVPLLTDQNKADLSRGAEEILLAREMHYPATIADLYDPKTMPTNLREAHERNDEVLERIYIGRRCRNDTERLEKLFEMYTNMTTYQQRPARGRGRRQNG